MVDYRVFARKIPEIINSHFSYNALRRKSQLCQLGHFKVSHVKMPKYDENMLFKTFRTCDFDHNGFLDWAEY